MYFLFALVLMASSAKAVVETQVEAGDAQIYQSVETTVNGETVKKESNQPGKLELEMEKNVGAEPTVSFTWEPQGKQGKITPVPTGEPNPPETPIGSFASQIIEFIKNLFSGLTSWFK